MINRIYGKTKQNEYSRQIQLLEKEISDHNFDYKLYALWGKYIWKRVVDIIIVEIDWCYILMRLLVPVAECVEHQILLKIWSRCQQFALRSANHWHKVKHVSVSLLWDCHHHLHGAVNRNVCLGRQRLRCGGWINFTIAVKYDVRGVVKLGLQNANKKKGRCSHKGEGTQTKSLSHTESPRWMPRM